MYLKKFFEILSRKLLGSKLDITQTKINTNTCPICSFEYIERRYILPSKPRNGVDLQRLMIRKLSF